jgi:hypothetical protein
MIAGAGDGGRNLADGDIALRISSFVVMAGLEPGILMAFAQETAPA